MDSINVVRYSVDEILRCDHLNTILEAVDEYGATLQFIMLYKVDKIPKCEPAFK